MKEIWKSIPNYPLYDISNFGNVRSWNGLGRRYGKRQPKPRLLKLNIGDTGYYRVTLCNKDEQKQYKIHHLVLMVFSENKPKNKITRHIDGNKLNNHIDNLAWGNYYENEQDKVAHGRSNRGTRNGKSKLTKSQVIKIRQLYETKEYSQKRLGNMFGVSRSAIMMIVTNKSWQYI